jgi:flagellin
MVTINTNYAAAFASNAAKQTSAGLNSAMEKLSTGSRINYARDDAAGVAISTRLTAEIEGLSMASRNAADAQSMLDYR